jgi:transcriptional regulator with XRE-family HTH domain
MDLNEKIKLILEQKTISPSIFADEIGVQRSSISHILAGRNKPSLDIVQKIVKRFPELGVNWIWDEDMLPAVSTGKKNEQPELSIPDSSKDDNAFYESPAKTKHTGQAVPKVVHTVPGPPSKERVVDKIMVLYTDGTFEEFKPAH